MLGALKLTTLIAISALFSADCAVYPGKCPFVPPSTSFDPNQVTGEWKILHTTDPVLKEDSTCAHSHITQIADGLLIQFSNHLKNGSIQDYNVTLKSSDDTPGFYTTLALNQDLELTAVTYYVESDFFMLWICATVSTEKHMEQIYIDGSSTDLSEEIIAKFFNHLAAFGSNVKRDSLSQLPETECHH